MATLRKGSLAAGAAAFGAAALLGVALDTTRVASASPGQPCYDGISPLNPYANNCALPSRPPHIRGAAPDQTALLNCGVGSRAMRAICLSNYVNS